MKAWMAEHYEWPVLFVVIYLLGCYFGKKHMDTVEYKNIWDSRMALAVWNALLCTFSFMGAIRTVPHQLYLITNTPFVETICTPPDHEWGVGATGLWVQLFILSKIPELVDTFFIVQRKRPLIFLHWYHHVTVLLYCWHSYATEASQALYFVAMNYSVHAVM
jgi:elongation of very long chain fatty acids protein 6